jgi:serine O-acetyltransferase
MSNYKPESIFIEIKKDLQANGWDNKKLTTALRFLILDLGMHLLVLYRIQYRVFKLPVIGKLLSRIIGLFSQILTSCQISPTAIVFGGVSIPHPTGIVIGKGAIVKSGCKLYQQVTLGADNNDCYPIVEENVTIYAGAKIIGGVNIGCNTVIGANSVVIRNLPFNSVAAGVPARIINK